MDEQLKAQRERDEHQKKTNYEKIVVALERIHNEQKAYSQQQKANDDRQDAREGRRLWLDTAAIVVAAIAACILFGQQNVMRGQLGEMHEAGIDAKQSLIATNRAWISPITAKIVGSTQNPQLSNFEVDYRNTGKDPALRFTAQEDADSIPLPTGQQIWRNVFETHPLKNVCARTKPDTEIAAYPGVNRIYYPAVDLTKLIHEISTGGQRALRLHGCFGYHSPITGEAIHKSEYCFLFVHITGNDPLAFETISCVYGNNSIEG